MTITEAIARLQQVEAKHGPQVEVYFDCPKCGNVFAPTIVKTQAIHLTGEQKHG